MADNVTTADGTISADERTIDTVATKVQRFTRHGEPDGTPVQVTVTNSDTEIVAANDNRSEVMLVNRQTVAVWVNIGAAATTSHFRLDPGDSVTWATSGQVKGITSAAYSASGDAKVHVMELHD